MSASEKIYRLLNYKNLLYRLKSIGFVKVFSDNIADSLDISPSLVRKDFREFGIRGTQKGGYQIDSMLETINSILGKNKSHKLIIVGAGKIGQALMNYPGFAKEGILITAAFDIDSERIKENGPIPVLPLEKLHDFVHKHKITLAILSVPESSASECLDLMIKVGIKGILNFTSMNLKSNGIIINNVNIGHELENLIFTVANR